ncbi:MAG TPA: glycosyltransferase family 9 protein [Chloroflexota bacterium]|nr:glycosyltransferase family 9 protein [Chloroflexota bacterium]
MRRILVVRAGALGDTVLALPAVRALRDRFPDARIAVAGYPANWEIAGDLVHEIHSIDHPIWAGLTVPGAAGALTRHLDGTDLVVAWTARQPDLGTLPIIHASPYPPAGVHAADHLLRSLEPVLGPQPEPAIPRLAVPTVLRRGILIHPGAGAEWKRWPADRFASLSGILVGRGHDVSLVEGPADASAVAAVLEHIPLPVVRLPSPRAVATILAGAELFVGNDSGVTHLAAAVGTPVVALFGPTNPAVWAPRGNVRIIRHCSATATGTDIRVCHQPNCMGTISVEQVLASIEAVRDHPPT